MEQIGLQSADLAAGLGVGFALTLAGSDVSAGHCREQTETLDASFGQVYFKA